MTDDLVRRARCREMCKVSWEAIDRIEKLQARVEELEARIGTLEDKELNLAGEAHVAELVKISSQACARAERAEARVEELEAALGRIKKLASLVAHDLVGRVEAGKVVAVQNCADIASAALKGNDDDDGG